MEKSDDNYVPGPACTRITSFKLPNTLSNITLCISFKGLRIFSSRSLSFGDAAAVAALAAATAIVVVIFVTLGGARNMKLITRVLVVGYVL